MAILFIFLREVFNLKIAICDDEQVFIKKFKKHLSEFNVNYNYEITAFNSGEELLDNYAVGQYDIIILDIEMKGMNGIETAKRIRIIDKDITIAFLTSHENFAIQGYDVKAERYILKQQPEHMYREQLAALFNEYIQKNKYFEYCNNNQAFSAKLSDILYFEVFIRQIMVHTLNVEFKYYGKLSDLEKNYSNYGFVRNGKSFLINISNIKFIDKEHIIMKNDDKIPLGRSVRNNVVEKYFDYLSGR